MFSKMCTRCRIVKSFFDFSPDNRTIDGKSCHCKACHRIDCRESRRRAKEVREVEQEIAEARMYDDEVGLIYFFLAMICSVALLLVVMTIV
jgi:hypothetical protein